MESHLSNKITAITTIKSRGNREELCDSYLENNGVGIVPDKQQNSDEQVTEGGQTCRSDVTCESPVIDSNLPLDGQKNDNEVTSDGQEKPFLPLLFGHLPRDGEPPENSIQPKKLQKPKIRQPKKMVKSEEESQILQEPVTSESKTSITHEVGENLRSSGESL